MGKSLSEASNMSQMLQESRAETEQGRDRAGQGHACRGPRQGGQGARRHSGQPDTYSLSSRPGIQVREDQGPAPRGSHSDQ